MAGGGQQQWAGNSEFRRHGHLHRQGITNNICANVAALDIAPAEDRSGVIYVCKGIAAHELRVISGGGRVAIICERCSGGALAGLWAVWRGLAGGGMAGRLVYYVGGSRGDWAGDVYGRLRLGG